MSRANRLAAEFLRDQMQTDGIQSSELSRIFKEEPPPLKTFLYDQKYLNHLRPTLPSPDLEGYAFELSPIQWDFLRNMEQIFYPELYIAMVEEFGQEWAPLPMKNMFAAAWGKGSSHPDTPIYDQHTGQWIKLRDFSGSLVASANISNGSIGIHYGTESFKEGEGRMFKVTTALGRTMNVWEGHRFLKYDKEEPSWKRLWDLKVGDSIGIATYLPEPAATVDYPGIENEDTHSLLSLPNLPKKYFSLPKGRVCLIIDNLFADGPINVNSDGMADDLINLSLRADLVVSKKKVGESFVVSVVGRGVEQFGRLLWDRIESIEYTHLGEYWTLSVDGPANYVSNGGVVDHNSGKDTVVRLGITRIASLLNHLKSPQGYFNMPSSDPIHCLNVATTAPQARRAFFDPMKQLFKSNKHMASMFYGDDPADGANQIRLQNDVYIISGNSMAESQEGLNLIAGVADEISAFKVAEEFRDKGSVRENRGAEGIVSFLRSSASSRFPETYKVVQISFPRFDNDAIEKAIKTGRESNKANGDKSTWYVSGPHATWEVKPTVTKANFQEHYDEDPDKAAAMYECKPPKSSNAFIRDEAAIDAAFSESITNPIEVEYYWGNPPQEAIGADLMPLDADAGWQVQFRFSDDLRPIDGALYCLHGDLAVKGDRAGIAMSHVKEYSSYGNEEDERPIIKNDFVFSFQADLSDKEHPREVQIRWYRQLIYELIDRGFEIDTVTFDQFQSFDMIQTLNMYGIDSGLLSLDRNDKVYQTFKDVILDRRLIGYRADTLEDFEDPRAAFELKRLRRVGRKVDHLPGQSKDEADALAGSVFNAMKAGGEEDSESTYQGTDGGLSEMEALMYGMGGGGGMGMGDSEFSPFTHPSEGIDGIFSPHNRY